VSKSVATTYRRARLANLLRFLNQVDSAEIERFMRDAKITQHLPYTNPSTRQSRGRRRRASVDAEKIGYRRIWLSERIDIKWSDVGD
jgi:hypothetical protein